MGRRYARKLTQMGIATGADLAVLPEPWLRRHLGGVVGLWRELHGPPCLGWSPAAWDEDGALPPGGAGRHSVTCTRSFSRPQHEATMLAEAVATFAAKAAEKLRRHGLAAHVVTVILGTDKHVPVAGPATHTAVVSLATATQDSSLLTQAALRGLQQLRRPGVAYHRAGVLFCGLETAGQTQLGLFAATAADQQRRQQLMATLDRLNGHFGRQLVHLAAAGVAKNSVGSSQLPTWAGRSAHRSLLSTRRSGPSCGSCGEFSGRPRLGPAPRARCAPAACTAPAASPSGLGRPRCRWPLGAKRFAPTR